MSAVFDLTGGVGADVAFEVVGRPETAQQVLTMTRRGGEACMVGMAPIDANLVIPLALEMVVNEKRIIGCNYGSADVRRDVPKFLEWWRTGRLPVERLISRTIGLDDVNDAIASVGSGDCTDGHRLRTAGVMTGTLQSQPDTSRQFLEVRNPADGSIVERLPIHDANEVSAIATALRAAQPEWEALGPHGRAKHLLAWLDWIMDHEDRLRELLQTESGKSWGDTTLETAVAVDVINYATKHAAEWLAAGPSSPSGWPMQRSGCGSLLGRTPWLE